MTCKQMINAKDNSGHLGELPSTAGKISFLIFWSPRSFIPFSFVPHPMQAKGTILEFVHVRNGPSVRQADPPMGIGKAAVLKNPLERLHPKGWGKRCSTWHQEPLV